jgi:hypothetical protein
MDKKIGMPNSGSGIGELSPSMKNTGLKCLVTGLFPARLAEGKEFLIADIRFQDGDLLFPVMNVLVYTGDELSITRRKYPREEGRELWIVDFRTAEKVLGVKRHGDAPNSYSTDPPVRTIEIRGTCRFPVTA